MVTAQDPSLQQIVGLIVAKVNPSKIILFGSRARGKAAPDSDIDLLIIEDNGQAERRKRLGQLYVDMVSLDRPAVDLLLYSQEEFDKWRHSAHHVIGRASLEGIVVYERCC